MEKQSLAGYLKRKIGGKLSKKELLEELRDKKDRF